MLAIACLSQKGGVGKSTLARLIARTYAAGDWKVKIADFNVKQKTSVDWSALRMAQGLAPEIPAEPFSEVSRSLRGEQDMVVFDGRPESDPQTLRLAQEATVVIIPCGVAADDLVPQIRFAHELRSRGIDIRKILFVLNKCPESPAAIADARSYIGAAGFTVTLTTLPMKVAYVNAHNVGRCIAETEFSSLNDRSTALAKEIVAKVEELQ